MKLTKIIDQVIAKRHRLSLVKNALVNLTGFPAILLYMFLNRFL